MSVSCHQGVQEVQTEQEKESKHEGHGDPRYSCQTRYPTGEDVGSVFAYGVLDCLFHHVVHECLDLARRERFEFAVVCNGILTSSWATLVFSVPVIVM